MKITSPKEAIELGLSTYFTGKPCKNGHISERHISGYCLECNPKKKKVFERILLDKSSEIKSEKMSVMEFRLQTEDVYFYGKKCKFGHFGLRYMNGNRCVECSKLSSKKQRESK